MEEVKELEFGNTKWFQITEISLGRGIHFVLVQNIKPMIPRHIFHEARVLT